MRPVYVSGALHALIEGLAENAAVATNSLPIKLYYLGSRTEFLAELPQDWHRTHCAAMTETFTDSVEIVFINTVSDLITHLYARGPASTNIVWGLVSYMRNTAWYHGSSTFNAHSLSNVFYKVTECVWQREKEFIFGDALDAVGNTNLTLDLLPEPSAAKATVLEQKPRKGVRKSTATGSEPGITSTPVRGSTDDPLTLEEILDKWFTIK